MIRRTLDFLAILLFNRYFTNPLVIDVYRTEQGKIVPTIDGNDGPDKLHEVAIESLELLGNIPKNSYRRFVCTKRGKILYCYTGYPNIVTHRIDIYDIWLSKSIASWQAYSRMLNSELSGRDQWGVYNGLSVAVGANPKTRRRVQSMGGQLAGDVALFPKPQN